MTDSIDCVVVGAGVVGLAVARELALRGREVVVLEAAEAIGTGTSSRNSEVLHAGIYYPAGSLKARLCVQGRRQLVDYCGERGVPYRLCGKLIVATATAQVAHLETIRAAAVVNGVHDLVLLTAAQAQAMEPQLACVAALWSPGTGIVDSHALMLALQGDLERAGGVVAFHSPLKAARSEDGGLRLTAADGTEFLASMVVNAAGLAAPALAAACADMPRDLIPRAYFAKGNYFSLQGGRSPFSRLIYPVPESAGLGVHLTLDMGGQAKFGPDVQWVESADDLVVDPARGDAFYAEVRKYWPALRDGALVPAYAGVRPKIQPAQAGAADFVIQGEATHGVSGLVNLFGIESPGLTSALAIGGHVADLCAEIQSA